MAEVKILYWSGTGNTAAMAQLVADGVTAGGATPVIVPFEETTPDSLASETAYALGCPSMGSEQLEESVVDPFVEELIASVSGKKILLFGSYGWGDGEWMRDWVEQMTGAGAEMIEAEGVICNDAPDSDAEEALTAAGKALAAAVN
ncbi:MAG: flavodoxin domain-containing protein [Lachnospiraceae bacterium]|nr:flavodoxin domain-containing protein [Lachnospiraceae bacterium]